jgi:hypothetical protein
MKGKVYGCLGLLLILYALLTLVALLDDLIMRIAYSDVVLAIVKRLGAP